MENKYRKIIIMLTLIFILSAISISAFELIEIEEDEIATEQIGNEDTAGTEPCQHALMPYIFDDESMTLNNVYEETCAYELIDEIEFFGDKAIVLDKGEKITDGLLKKGMTVQVYHGDVLYGEYIITDLVRPIPDVPTNGNLSADVANGGNAYGFILPVDNIILKDTLEGNIKERLGSDNGGPNFGYPDHLGIDIARGGVVNPIEGKEVRAVKAGTVTYSQEWDGVTDSGDDIQTYGNFVEITHDDGLITRYAHMIEKPKVEKDQRVEQGDVLGYVGKTGAATGPHLHFEVRSGKTVKDPIGYLTGAPTYNPILTGWQQENGEWYYYNAGGTKKTSAWQDYRYLDATGKMVRGWPSSKIGTAWFYFNPVAGNPSPATSDNGKMVTGWHIVGNYTRYFEPGSGELVTGWKDITLSATNSGTYYFEPTGSTDTNGRLIRNFKVVDGYTRYFEPGAVSPITDPESKVGQLVTGWKDVTLTETNSGTYYFEWTNDLATKGRLIKNFHIIDGYTRYFEPGTVSPVDDPTTKVGQLVTGWKDITLSSTNSGTYYFEWTNDLKTKGRLIRNFHIVDGYTRYFEPGTISPITDPESKVGQLVTGWKDITLSETNSGTYYFEWTSSIATKGRLIKNFHIVDGYTRYFEPGAVSPVTDPETKVGQLATGFRDIELSATNSGTYYFEPSESNETKGKMVKGWQDQGGSTRYFETGAESPAQNLSAKTGQMAIGFTMIRLSDSNVGTYYFEPIGSDSIRGRMLKGWQSISGGIYYFNPDKNVSPANSTVTKTGQMLSGKWYSIAEKPDGTPVSQMYLFDRTGKLTDEWAEEYSQTFADNSWQVISSASEAGVAPYIWNVGDEKDITLSSGERVTLQIYGFNVDTLTAGGKAGMTFGLKEQMQQARRMHSADDNTVGFTGTEMYSWLNTELYNQLPADLRGVIKTTDKKTSVGSGNGQTRCDSMKIFLFSEEECFGRAIQSWGGESASNESYPIFTDDASRVKILPGPQIIEWWLRSPRYEGLTQFCLVHSTGQAGYTSASWEFGGVVFGFCV